MTIGHKAGHYCHLKKRVGDRTASGGEFVPVPDCVELLLPQSINMLIILPLLGEICWEREALDANVSRVLATTASVGRAFQFLMVRGRKECCRYRVLNCD